MKIQFLLASFLIFTVGFSQYDPSRINKKAVQLYEQAMSRIDDGNLASAAGLLQQAVDLDKNCIDAYIALAGVFSEYKNYKNSALNLEKAFALDSNYTL